MSSQRIKSAALRLFAEKGYEGTSLADIIEHIGIKKSSIYNHYKSKDDLFLSIYDTCIAEELYFLKQYFINASAEQHTSANLKAFIKEGTFRTRNVLSTQFLVRFIYFPPHHLTQELIEKGEYFLNELAQLFFHYLHNQSVFQNFTEQELLKFVHLYSVIIQGIFSDKSLAGGLCTEERLEISWDFIENTFPQLKQ